MPSSLNPFGLKAKHSPSGIIRPQRWVVPASAITGTPANWDNLYQDDAVYIDGNGSLRLTNSGNSATANAACIGSFSGVEFNDSNGRRTVSNQFNKSLILNPVANTGLGTTDVWFWLYTDPELVYEIQVAGSNAGAASTSTYAAIGNALTYNQNATSVNSVVGFSAGYAYPWTGTYAAGTTAAPFVIYNLAYDNQPNNTYTVGQPPTNPGNSNSWTDSYPNVLVKLANPQFGGNLPGF